MELLDVVLIDVIGADIAVHRREVRTRILQDDDEAERQLPSLWIDMETFEVVQIDRGDGVRIRFGPSGVFDDIRAPSWIEIEAPDKPRARLDVMGVSTANAAAAAFGTDWLVPPEEP